MNKSLMKIFKNLENTETAKGIITPGCSKYPDHTLYHSCRIHDYLLIAQKTKEPFDSIIDKLGYFKEYDGNDDRMLYAQGDTFCALMTLSLIKSMLPNEQQPTQEQLQQYISQIEKPTYSGRLEHICKIVPKGIDKVTEFLAEPEMQQYSEDFAPVVEALDNVKTTIAPYAEEAKSTIQKIKSIEEAKQNEINNCFSTFGENIPSILTTQNITPEE